MILVVLGQALLLFLLNLAGVTSVAQLTSLRSLTLKVNWSVILDLWQILLFDCNANFDFLSNTYPFAIHGSISYAILGGTATIKRSHLGNVLLQIFVITWFLCLVQRVIWQGRIPWMETRSLLLIIVCAISEFQRTTYVRSWPLIIDLTWSEVVIGNIFILIVLCFIHSLVEDESKLTMWVATLGFILLLTVSLEVVVSHVVLTNILFNHLTADIDSMFR